MLSGCQHRGTLAMWHLHQQVCLANNFSFYRRIARSNKIPDDTTAGSVPVRPFFHNYDGDQSKAWAKQQLLECEQFHQTCTPPTSNFLPRRLLRIEGTYPLRVRLCFSTSSEVQVTARTYATLSYCWGGLQVFHLNADTEPQLIHGMDISSLPKTLGDAVSAAWALGLQWIWIDSLCIPQDDVEVKALEVAQMYLVYMHSHITISASRASSCQEGFMQPCSLPFHDTVGFSLPFASPCGRLGSIVLSRGEVRPPIDERSWPLQEHLLARRVLRYTNFRLHWSCTATSAYEEGQVLGTYGKGSLPPRHSAALDRMAMMYNDLRDKDRSVQHWMHIVEQYTKRDLTDASDKLPAISGIATFWDPSSKDEYLAGLWRSHLPLGLLWNSAQPFLQTCSWEYRAPSWSWASLDGQIDWHYHHFDRTDPNLRIKSCNVERVYENAPYGAVKSGTLKLQGHLQIAYIEADGWLAEAALPADDRRLETLEGALRLDLATVHPDCWDDALAARVNGAQMFGLRVTLHNPATGSGPTGLILATQDGDTYWRIGLFQFDKPQKEDMEETLNLEAAIELWELRKMAQRTAFQGPTLRSVTII